MSPVGQGTSDSFEFFQTSSGPVRLFTRILGVGATSPFAKAGLVVRDGTDPGAASVIVDAKPDGGVEFMARMCGGCETTYLGGAQMTFPVFLILVWDGSTARASVSEVTDNGSPDVTTTIGSVTLSMSHAVGGLAVTSHDPSRTTMAVFDSLPF